MALTERFTADIKAAMLARDSETVSVLRMVQAELKNAAIAKMEPLTDMEEIKVVQKAIKARTDAAKMYSDANQKERATKEQSEAGILQKYLPAQADLSTIETFVKDYAAKLGTLEPRHKGEIIRATMQEFEGQVDGQQVAGIVNTLFS